MVKIPRWLNSDYCCRLKWRWTVPNPGNLKDGDEVTATAKIRQATKILKEPVDGLAPAIDISDQSKDPITGETDQEQTLRLNSQMAQQ